jgi:PAS domain S-box-containing protein
LAASHFADVLTGMPRRAGALAATLGAVALAGWSANVDIMRRLLPGAPLILPNTALALVLLAMALVLLDGAPDHRRRQLAALISATVAAFGAVTIVQHTFAFSLPSDLWLFGDRVLAADLNAPGRTARAAGFSFVLLGGAQCLIAVRHTRYIELARTAAAAVLVIALSATVNSVDNAPAVFPLSRLIGMALPTAIALTLLAAGTIALHSSHGVMALFLRRGPAGEMVRRLVPPTLIVPPLVAIVVVSGRIWGWYGPTVSVSILLMLSMAVLLATIVRLTIGVARLEDARETAERREATTFHLAAVGVAHFGVDGLLLRANQRFAEMFGIDATRDLGVNWHDFVIGERIPSSEMLTQLEKGEVSSVHVERPFRRRDGSEIWVRANVSVAPTTAGEADFHIVVADDVSERKRVEEEARALDLRVERVARLESIGALAGGVAHDFNNILAAILGNASVARAEVPPESTLALHLAEVEQAARRAADLTSQLLAYAGKSMRRPEPVQLDALAIDAVRVFEPSVRHRVTVRLEHARPARVLGDVAQLRQVALALLTNASEALSGRDEGQVVVRTGTDEVAAGDGAERWWPGMLETGSYGFFEVTDDGPGLDAHVRDRLFEPFVSTKFIGRGLGLAAALGIVRAHQGAIEVSSAPGQGSRFRLWFPLASPPPTSVS